jgi:hypothetical protein
MSTRPNCYETRSVDEAETSILRPSHLAHPFEEQWGDEYRGDDEADEGGIDALVDEIRSRRPRPERD